MAARYALPLILLLFAMPASADSMMQAMMAMHISMTASRNMFCSFGTVVQVEAQLGRVSIRHSEVPQLGMPAMTTAFKVRDKSVLNGVKVGELVGFDFVRTDEGLVVTSLLHGSR